MPAWAGNGNILHGVGAVNDAMGGAGVALPNDTLGALNLNPALLARLSGHRFEFSVEQADADNAVESRVGPFSGRTEESGDPAIIPAFGWTRHSAGRSAVGMGVLGLAGFGVDYPQDPTNPILSPQPFGFGRVYSNYQMLKIPFAFAWEVNPSLAVGASLNAAHASLAADPAGFAAPDCSAGGRLLRAARQLRRRLRLRRPGGRALGHHPVVRPRGLLCDQDRLRRLRVEQRPRQPQPPNFGTARTIEFGLDAPASFAVGLGWKPTSRLDVALDGKWVNFADTDGFGGSGTDAMGNALGLGWEDIPVWALGVQFRALPRLTLRAGYNMAENPIPDSAAFFNVSSPAVFEDHACVGFGWQVVPQLEPQPRPLPGVREQRQRPLRVPRRAGSGHPGHRRDDDGLDARQTFSFHL